MHLELLSDKVEIVPSGIAEETGVERESDASWRCRRFLRKKKTLFTVVVFIFENLFTVVVFTFDDKPASVDLGRSPNVGWG